MEEAPTPDLKVVLADESVKFLNFSWRCLPMLARKDSVQWLVLLSGFPFGTTALTTWNGFCLVEIQQSVVFTITAEHQQSAAEHAKASPSLWSHENLVDFLAIHNVEQYVCYQFLVYEPV
ncbi:unnamed protein product [Sphagnum balticum]